MYFKLVVCFLKEFKVGYNKKNMCDNAIENKNGRLQEKKEVITISFVSRKECSI